MKIAYLGWGSLVWDPRNLHVRGEWLADGPGLPIEFSRESGDKRVTLVLTPGATRVTCLWAVSSLASLDAAVADLALREKIKEKNVKYSVGVWRSGVELSAGTDPEICHWAARLGLDGVVWTKLKPRFGDVERVVTEDEVIGHLAGLPPEQKASAERYVRMAPRQIDTPYRRRMVQAFGWTPLGRM